MGAYDGIDRAIVGLTKGFNPRVASPIAKEDIDFGQAVFGRPGVQDEAFHAHQDLATVTLDGDLVGSNVITTTINDIAVATTYGSSHAASMTAHIAAINAKAELIALGITAEAGSTNRIILIKGVGLDLTVTSVVTLGSGQAGVTVVLSTWMNFIGIAMFTHLGGRDYGAGTAKYFAGMAVNVMTLGEIMVATPSSVQDKVKAYVILAPGANQSKFTSTAAGAFDADLRFDSNTANGMAYVALRSATR